MAEEFVIELDEEVYAQCEEACQQQGIALEQLIGGWVKWIALPRKKMEIHTFYRKTNPVSEEL